MRILALDVGEKRIGIAVSDPTGTLASPVGFLERTSLEEEATAIAELVRRLEVEKIVIGNPLSLKGTRGPQAQEVERYAEALAARLEVPIVLWDERFSTVRAERLTREAGHKGRKRRARIDAAAAAIILQDYLEAMRSGR